MSRECVCVSMATHHSRSRLSTVAQAFGAEPPGLAALGYPRCQRLNPVAALVVGIGWYPSMLSSTHGPANLGPLLSSRFARERVIAGPQLPLYSC